MRLNNSTDLITSTRQARFDQRVGSHRLAAALTLCSLLAVSSLDAQVMGDEAELARLRIKAEDAVAGDDPDGAAMNAGRAALMAAQLARKHEGFERGLYKATESLLRSQEHTYRAMALFRRAGNQLPASSGVCGSLAMAQSELTHTAASIEALPAQTPTQRLADEAKQVKASVEDWRTMIEATIADYQCR
jgi:hypothetical protein